jgi:L,D-transpeptidase YbiS
MAIGAVVAMALVTAGLVAADRLSLRYRPVTIVVHRPETPATVATALGNLRPKAPFVVVDTANNRLAIVQADGSVEHVAPCSTGSGTTLRDPETGKTWVFNTPLGVHKIRRKVKDPVWVKPDWAFIEEGERPPKRRSDRYDDVSLGDYALYMDDGYLIHGTLFQTLLGRGVTHGCIRLGDKDLELVFRRVPAGAAVLIF